MPNHIKIDFINELSERFGNVRKLPGSLSLYEIGDGACRVYIRYSKIHGRNQSFYGIRKEDLLQLDGFNAVICFLWNDQDEPLFIPYGDFEEVFASVQPASDGQYKAQIYHGGDGLEFYVAQAGRFNVEAFVGWDNFTAIIDDSKLRNIPDFTHSQIQTLIGSIGIHRGYDVWIPTVDRGKLDCNLTKKFDCVDDLPQRYSSLFSIVKQVDVLWLRRGSSDLSAMFEVEHSTSIYSGLLRFNDLHLVEPNLKPKFSIVSNDIRRALFLRQINRPTFKVSGLSDLCSFLEYKDVFGWYRRTTGA